MFLIPPKPSMSWENAKEQRKPGCEESAPKTWGGGGGRDEGNVLKMVLQNAQALEIARLSFIQHSTTST